MPGFARYVAIGDSSTEGLDDPDGRGGYRGWADRLAARLAALEPDLLYANLGVRGRTTREIRETQLDLALAMRPDLMTLFSGTNDMLARRFDPGAFATEVETMQRAIRDSGATLLTFTLPSLTPLMPAARRLEPRLEAMNEAVRRAARSTGTLLVDFAAHPVASDRRLWSADRLHANAAGHQRIAAALADALALPGADASWSAPLSPDDRGRVRRLASEIRWTVRYLVPWMVGRLRSRESGARAARARRPKRPELSRPGSV